MYLPVVANTARRRTPVPRKQKHVDSNSSFVPIIPDWVGSWMPALLVGCGLLLLASGVVGVRDGAVWGWTLLLAIVAAAVSAWARGYLRRHRRNREKLDRELCARSEFPVVDVMSGDEFESYCFRLLPFLGYWNLERIGGPGDGGADILATGQSGDVAVQCKRRSGSIGPWAVRELAGTVAGGRHARRSPILMTNAFVTPGCREAARELDICVIGREELGRAMWLAKSQTAQGQRPASQARAERPDASLLSAMQEIPGDILATGAIMLGAVTTIVIVMIYALVAGPVRGSRPPAVGAVASASNAAGEVARGPSQPAPAKVVQDYYEAINRRDWPLVWRLGGRNVGTGPAATYAGMVAG